MRRKTTSVHHWRLETGDPEYVGKSIVYPDGIRDGVPSGWYCWVYPVDDVEFADWMALSCPSAECVHRFNSGDPVWTVFIPDDREATLFMLRWL